jgi:2-polyprenyl-3-methyl-5-hydroxy-6-metoxy-1,4-benzoquinol methylase
MVVDGRPNDSDDGSGNARGYNDNKKKKRLYTTNDSKQMNQHAHNATTSSHHDGGGKDKEPQLLMQNTTRLSSGSLPGQSKRGEENVLDDEKAKRIAEKWDNANKTFVKGGAWHQHPLVVKTYAQSLASNSDNFVTHLLETYGKRSKCLSIGCGDGGIEIQMVQSGLCATTMKGIDLSSPRISLANEKVPMYLRDKIEFHVENAEKDIEEGQEFDLVLFTHSFHHIFDLEGIANALRDRITMDCQNGGILVLEVGPVRWQFPQHHLDLMTNFLKDIEKEFPSYVEAIHQNGFWDGKNFVPPNANAVKRDDPSETVRSDEIIPVLSDYFTLLENVSLGGIFFNGCFKMLIIHFMMRLEMR